MSQKILRTMQDDLKEVKNTKTGGGFFKRTEPGEKENLAPKPLPQQASDRVVTPKTKTPAQNIPAKTEKGNATDIKNNLEKKGFNVSLSPIPQGKAKEEKGKDFFAKLQERITRKKAALREESPVQDAKKIEKTKEAGNIKRDEEIEKIKAVENVKIAEEEETKLKTIEDRGKDEKEAKKKETGNPILNEIRQERERTREDVMSQIQKQEEASRLEVQKAAEALRGQEALRDQEAKKAAETLKAQEAKISNILREVSDSLIQGEARAEESKAAIMAEMKAKLLEEEKKNKEIILAQIQKQEELRKQEVQKAQEELKKQEVLREQEAKMTQQALREEDAKRAEEALRLRKSIESQEAEIADLVKRTANPLNKEELIEEMRANIVAEEKKNKEDILAQMKAQEMQLSNFIKEISNSLRKETPEKEDIEQEIIAKIKAEEEKTKEDILAQVRMRDAQKEEEAKELQEMIREKDTQISNLVKGISDSLQEEAEKGEVKEKLIEEMQAKILNLEEEKRQKEDALAQIKEAEKKKLDEEIRKIAEQKLAEEAERSKQEESEGQEDREREERLRREEEKEEADRKAAEEEEKRVAEEERLKQEEAARSEEEEKERLEEENERKIKEEEERMNAEEEERLKQDEEEKRRQAEAEEQAAKAEEERLKQEEEEKRANEEERLKQEESAQKAAEEERLRQEEEKGKQEEAEAQASKAEEERIAEEERLKQKEAAQKAIQEEILQPEEAQEKEELKADTPEIKPDEKENTGEKKEEELDSSESFWNSLRKNKINAGETGEPSSTEDKPAQNSSATGTSAKDEEITDLIKRVSSSMEAPTKSPSEPPQETAKPDKDRDLKDLLSRMSKNLQKEETSKPAPEEYLKKNPQPEPNSANTINNDAAYLGNVNQDKSYWEKIHNTMKEPAMSPQQRFMGGTSVGSSPYDVPAEKTATQGEAELIMPDDVRNAQRRIRERRQEESYVDPGNRLIYGKQEFYSTMHKSIKPKTKSASLEGLDGVLKEEDLELSDEEEKKRLRQNIITKYGVKIFTFPWVRVILITIIFLSIFGGSLMLILPKLKTTTTQELPAVVAGKSISDINKLITAESYAKKSQVTTLNYFDANLEPWKKFNNGEIIRLHLTYDDQDVMLSRDEALKAVLGESNASNIPADFLDATASEYNVLVFKESSSSLRLALVFKYTPAKEEEFKDIMSKWEKTNTKSKKIYTVMKNLFINARIIEQDTLTFQPAIYNGTELRFVNLPDSNTSMDYFLYDGFIVFTSSKDHTFQMIDKLKS